MNDLLRLNESIVLPHSSAAASWLYTHYPNGRPQGEGKIQGQKHICRWSWRRPITCPEEVCSSTVGWMWSTHIDKEWDRVIGTRGELHRGTAMGHREEGIGNMGGTGLWREDRADFYCEQVVGLNIVNMKYVWEHSNKGLVCRQKSDGVPNCRQTEFITFQKGKKKGVKNLRSPRLKPEVKKWVSEPKS